MIAGMIAVGLGVDEKYDRLVGDFFDRGQHVARVQRVVQLSIITTPSWVTTKLQVVVVASGAKT
jgi:hypothetical protein